VATEIERKFLVMNEQWRASGIGERIRQGYVWADTARSVRVRIAGVRGFLTLKSARTGYSRQEYEYEIPLSDAQEMLTSLCDGALIEKTRYTVRDGGREWVVDVFDGDNKGLVVAEIELGSEDEEIDLPAWAGCEVTTDPRYLNVNLVARPYSLWSAAERATADRTTAADR
jgi:CYTH domain-containing protein